MAQQAASRRDTARATLTRDTAAETAAAQQVATLQVQLHKAKAALQHSEAVGAAADRPVAVCADRDFRAGDQLWLPNIVRSVGQAIVLTPLASIAMTGIAPQESGAPSGVFNMLRNLGGAFGTALPATIATKRERFHSNIIGGDVTMFRDVRERLNALVAYFKSHGVSDAALAQRKVIVVLGDIVREQSMIVACADTCAVLGALLLLATGLLLLTLAGRPAAPVWAPTELVPRTSSHRATSRPCRVWNRFFRNHS
jgi:hypothetical protein